jgi:hypothetical protein
MCSSTREAFLALVTTALHMVAPTVEAFSIRDFYALHAPLKGSLLLNLDKQPTEPWAHAVVDDALRILTEWEATKP